LNHAIQSPPPIIIDDIKPRLKAHGTSILKHNHSYQLNNDKLEHIFCFCVDKDQNCYLLENKQAKDT
jgi:hypothetical protein